MAHLEASLPMYGPGVVDEANAALWAELRERVRALVSASHGHTNTYLYDKMQLDWGTLDDGHLRFEYAAPRARL